MIMGGVIDNSKSFPRLFTVAEANSLLPALRPLMESVFQAIEILRSRGEQIIREGGLTPDSPNLMKRLKRDDSVVLAIQKVQKLVEEIHRLDCVCKGVEQGLVDFPCLMGEEIVFLCWRYGEESVSHWHHIHDGFAGRRPLLDSEKRSGVSYH